MKRTIKDRTLVGTVIEAKPTYDGGYMLMFDAGGEPLIFVALPSTPAYGEIADALVPEADHADVEIEDRALLGRRCTLIVRPTRWRANRDWDEIVRLERLVEGAAHD